MKVFISQPMNGKTEEEIKEIREKAVESLRAKYPDEQITVINNIFKGEIPQGVNPGLWFLGRSFKLLANADIAYFANDWEKYRGCRLENEAAIEYGLEVIEDYKK